LAPAIVELDLVVMVAARVTDVGSRMVVLELTVLDRVVLGRLTEELNGVDLLGVGRGMVALIDLLPGVGLE